MAEAAIIAGSILILAIVLAAREFRRDDLRDVVGGRVVVQLADATIVGTLKTAGRTHLTVVKATAGIDDARPVDGSLRIPRNSDIRYVQAVGD